MSNVSNADLKKHIKEILKTADLSVVTSKMVRGKLEDALACSLTSRKKEIDAIVLQEINEAEDSGSESEAEDNNKGKESEEESEEEKPKKKRAAPARKAPAKKKKKKSVNGTDTNSDSDDGSDEDYNQKKKTKKSKAGSGPKKGTGFTRPYNLSKELSAVVGAESLPRHEVVKKIWAIIKERNLYDPENKQFAICDDELMSVMKIKRFRTFGMLKYLKPHFIN